MLTNEKLNKRRYVFLLYTVLSIVMTWPLLRHLNELPFDPTRDTFLFTWSFWWLKQSLLHFSNPFISTTLFYPIETNLGLATLSLPYSLIAQPFLFLLGDELGMAVAFNLIIFMSFVLTAYFTYLLARKLGLNPMAAFFAGVLYSFSTIHFENRTRYHLLCLEFFPLTLLVLFDLLNLHKEDKKKGVLLGLALGFLISIIAYMSQTFSLHIAIIVPIFSLAIVVKHRFLNINTSVVLAIMVSVLSFVLLTFPLLYHIAQFYDTATIQELAVMNPDLSRFVRPGLNLSLYAWLDGLTGLEPLAIEHNHNFPGYFLYIFAFIGFLAFQPKKEFGGKWPWIMLFVIGLLLAPGRVLFVGPLGIYGSVKMPLHYIYEVLTWLKTDRAPDRYFDLVVLVLAFPAGIGVSRFVIFLERLKKPTLSRWAPFVFLVVILIELKWKPMEYHAPDKIFPPKLDRLHKVLDSDTNLVVTLPIGLEEKHAFYLQQRTGVRVMVVDYARVANLYKYKILKDAGLFQYFAKPQRLAQLSPGDKRRVCTELKAVFKENKIHVAYLLPAPPHYAGLIPEIQDTDQFMRSCADLVFENQLNDTIKYYLPANLYVFTHGDSTFKEKFLRYIDEVEPALRH